MNVRDATARPIICRSCSRRLIAVISKYVKINPDDIKVHVERQDTLEILEVKIEMPAGLRTATLACARSLQRCTYRRRASGQAGAWMPSAVRLKHAARPIDGLRRSDRTESKVAEHAEERFLDLPGIVA